MRLDVEYDPRVNLALAHARVPLVKAVTVRGDGTPHDASLRLSLWAEPGLAARREVEVVSPPPGASRTLEALALPLSAPALAAWGAAGRGTLHVELSNGRGVLGSRALPLEVLPRDTWQGLDAPAELLAAFVAVDDPGLDPLARQAREQLEAWTGDPDPAAYARRDPGRARRAVAAAWTVVRSLPLGDAPLPADWASRGVRLRGASALRAEGRATPLERALLLAGLLERLGLHPLVALTRDGALAGAWLVDERLPVVAVEDALRLLKRVELGELALADPAAPAEGGFDGAAAEAVRRLEAKDAMRLAVDVAAARAAGVEGLPRELELTEIAVDLGPPPLPAADAPADDPAVALAERAGAKPPPLPPPREPASKRLDAWRNKLLDLSLRNRLLNYRESRRSVPLMAPDVAALEDALADGGSFALHARPVMMDAAGGDEARLRGYVEAETRAGRLHAALTETELKRRLTEVWRAARTAREESGANTLFVAIGFLAWSEAPGAEATRMAPLILLPLEMTRERAGAPFRVALGEDEALLNVTLLHKLRSEHGLEVPGLDELPRDTAGLDVPLILRRFREAVRDQDGWRVVERAEIALFTFARHVMWHDLTARADALLASPMVRHLLEGAPLPEQAAEELPDVATLDRRYHPREVVCPLDADATQLRAVFAATEGRSFVLHGPPGTGKSQTIANLVAQCVASGRRVLFVSEKMAALDVVHGRLEAAGLGDFCLELHSAQARKRDVVQEFARPLELAGARSPEAWQATADALAERRAELAALARALSAPRPLGMSVREAAERLVAAGDAPRLPLAFDTPPEDFAAAQLAELREAVDQALAAGRAVGDPATHPWSTAMAVRWTPELEREAERRLAALEQAASVLGGAWKALAERLRAPLDAASSRQALQAVDDVAELLDRCPEPPRALLEATPWRTVRAQLGEWLDAVEGRGRRWGTLAPTWKPDLLRLEVDGLLDRFHAWAGSFVLLRWLALWSARRALRRALAAPELPPDGTLATQLQVASETARADRRLAEVDDEARALLGPLWRGPGTDVEQVREIVAWADRLRATRDALQEALGEEAGEAVAARVRQLATERSGALDSDSALGRALAAWRSARATYRRALEEVDALLHLDEVRAFGGDGPDWLGRIRAQCETWQRALKGLRGWAHWLRARERLVELGLAPLLAACEGGGMALAELPDALERSVLGWWLDAVVRADQALLGFSREEHARRVERFRELDRELIALAGAEARARLAARIPAPDAPRSDASELSILLREMQKRRRHLPIRRLLREIPTLVGALKPCLLMSPLSVAQHLDPALPPFDLVVFDEASQIPAWHALGAVGRAEQLVVVGDPQQLPPTTFFQKLEADDLLADDDFDELESILDECLASGLPRLQLGWHYRSRHESLIAFSNHHYYGGRLLTFPAAGDGEEVGVRWVPVPHGWYDRAGSRTNRAEALAVVDEVVRRLTDPAEASRSLGIVTFSLAQQRLVEDLLDEARQRTPAIEPCFVASDERPEPVFVKNLENVQGDERDVILFSVCYGPDRSGQVTLNLGPLNREGGERRLNVAITRAREQLVVFSTLAADELDLRRTSARGVHHLKRFLAYAAGRSEVVLADDAGRARAGGAVAERIAGALERLGHAPERRVGASSFRVDLAVRDAERPDRYLLGVLLDGPDWSGAPTVRDRERTREAVLTRLGWRLHRVWTLDWLHDPEAEIQRLEEALEAARQAAPRVAGGPRTALSRPRTDERKVAEVVARYVAAGDLRTAGGELPGATPYVATPPEDLPVGRAAAARFFDLASLADVMSHVARVVEVEAPVSVELVARRLADAWGLSRVTRKVVERVEGAVARGVRTARYRVVDGFLWRPDQDPETFEGFRVPDPTGLLRRDAEDLPVREVANAALAVLGRAGAVPEEDLVRDLTRLFGFARTGTRLREVMAAGVEQLVAEGRAERDGERVKAAGVPAEPAREPEEEPAPEAATDPAEDTTDVLQETTDAVQETTDVLQETTDVLQETTDVLQETTDVLQETTDVLQETTDVLQETTDVLQETTDVGGAESEARDETRGDGTVASDPAPGETPEDPARP